MDLKTWALAHLDLVAILVILLVLLFVLLEANLI